MKLTCHKTEAVYRRYAIVSESDLSDGLKKLAVLREAEQRSSHYGTICGTAAQMPQRAVSGEVRSMSILVPEAGIEPAWAF